MIVIIIIIMAAENIFTKIESDLTGNSERIYFCLFLIVILVFNFYFQHKCEEDMMSQFFLHIFRSEERIGNSPPMLSFSSQSPLKLERRNSTQDCMANVLHACFLSIVFSKTLVLIHYSDAKGNCVREGKK